MQAAYPNDASVTRQAVLGLAKALLCAKQYDEAEKWFRQIADAPPEAGGHAEAELGLGRVAEAREKTAEAVDRYNRALRMGRPGTPTVDEAAFRLGTIFINMPEKDPKKAKDNAKAALAYFARLVFSTGPMAEEAMFMIGTCHERIGSIDAARAGYQNYLKRFADGKFADRAKERLKALNPPPK
jgi:TolA-binding protein